MSICSQNHRYDAIFDALPESQKFYDQSERHKCAGCAYEQGFQDARNGRSQNIDLEILDKSQAGTVRHKDPLVAYDLGYAAGLRP